jgi:hypothetical protein
MSIRTERETVRAGSSEILNKYSSVSISCGGDACPSAAAVAGTRYLVSDAPDLPLPGCKSATCNCGYVHYRDRRSFLSNRRGNSRLENGPSREGAKNERRLGEDRRLLTLHANYDASSLLCD